MAISWNIIVSQEKIQKFSHNTRSIFEPMDLIGIWTYMCCSLEYWGKKNVHDLPHIPIPEDQFEEIKQKYIPVKNVKNKYKNPTQKIKSQYKKAKRRFEIGQQMISNQFTK